MIADDTSVLPTRCSREVSSAVISVVFLIDFFSIFCGRRPQKNIEICKLFVNTLLAGVGGSLYSTFPDSKISPDSGPVSEAKCAGIQNPNRIIGLASTREIMRLSGLDPAI